MPRPQFLPRHPPATPDEIKALRLAAGLSMAHLAKLLQVSVASYEGWEYGRNRLPAPIFKLMKMVLTRRIRLRRLTCRIDLPQFAAQNQACE